LLGTAASLVLKKIVVHILWQGDLVTVTFNSADPRNNLMTMNSFLAVEKRSSDGSWEVVYTDSHWVTK